MSNFSLFQRETNSFEHRKSRLKANRASLKVDLLKKRSDQATSVFDDVMQADFFLFIRALTSNSSGYQNWYPETLIYMGHGQRPFKIFSRCLSKAYAGRVLPILGLDEPGLKKLVEELRDPRARSYLQYGHTHLDAGKLLNIENWGTAP